MKDAPSYIVIIVKDGIIKKTVYGDKIWALDDAEYAMFEDDVIEVKISIYEMQKM